MIQGIAFLALSLTSLFGIIEQPAVTPPNPQPGQKITLTVDSLPGLSEKPLIVFAAQMADTALVEIVQGKKLANSFSFSYSIPEKSLFIQYFIEDNNESFMPENLPFYGIPLYGKDAKPIYDSYRLYANLYLDSDTDHLKKAREHLEKELANYPMNWAAFVLLKRIELELGETDESRIGAKLDTLLELKPDSLEALYFAAMEFFMTSTSFKDKASELMLTCAEKYPESPYWTNYQYSIYGFIKETPERLGDYEGQVFPLLKGKARESGYFLLMSYALSGRRLKRIQDIADSFLKEFPSSSLAPAFIVTMLGIKYDQPNAEWAQELDKWWKSYPNDPEINFQLAEYYKERSWNTALTYYRNGLKASKTPQTAVVFAEAAADKGRNFAEALRVIRNAIAETNQDQYRKLLWWENFETRQNKLLQSQASLYMAEGWLSFKSGNYDEAMNELLEADTLLSRIPAYSEELYRKLLAVSEKAGNLNVRKTALVNLLIVQPQDTATQDAIKDIYLIEHEDTTGFGDWFFNEKMKVALRNRMNVTVPDFELTDLSGNQITLKSLQGKVVVINFWATWCQPCRDEMPALNSLVKEFRDRNDVVFLGVTNEDPKVIDGFLNKNTFLYNIYIDNAQVASMFKIDSVPTHIVIDKKGRLQFQHIGSFPSLDRILASEINALLEDK
jgi:thiol-disulfide isomerase/thioredoxin